MSETMSKITAITGGTVIDGTGAKPIKNAMVIIRDSYCDFSSLEAITATTAFDITGLFGFHLNDCRLV